MLTGTPSAPLQVAAAVLFHDGALLLAQRYPGTHLGGLWEFPGGKLEAGEDHETCLRREVREELGIEIRVREELQAVTHVYPERTVHIRFFRCSLVSGIPQPLGCNAVCWVTREQLGAYHFPAADAQLLELLNSSAALWGR